MPFSISPFESVTFAGDTSLQVINQLSKVREMFWQTPKSSSSETYTLYVFIKSPIYIYNCLHSVFSKSLNAKMWANTYRKHTKHVAMRSVSILTAYIKTCSVVNKLWQDDSREHGNLSTAFYTYSTFLNRILTLQRRAPKHMCVWLGCAILLN